MFIVIVIALTLVVTSNIYAYTKEANSSLSVIILITHRIRFTQQEQYNQHSINIFIQLNYNKLHTQIPSSHGPFFGRQTKRRAR